MKTADRVLATGLVPPFSLRSHAEAAALWREQSEQILAALPRSPVLVADNVAAYTRGRVGFVLEEFPCLAPPWPEFWVEYPSTSGKQRRAVMVRDASEDHRSVEGSFENSIEDARRNGFEGDPRWVLDCAMFVENEEHRVCGPVGWLVLALDDNGMCVGNRWVLGTPRGPEVVDAFRLLNGNRFNEEWLLAAVIPALQAISFLHCRNVAVDTVEPPPKLSAKHRKKHGRPLLRYQQVRLEVPRAASGRRGSGTGTMGPPSLHIVAGHMAHYGDCHPPRPLCPQKHGYERCGGCGGHTPHGLLFGKHQGMYWQPQTVRGDPTRGEVSTDFELVVKGD